MIICLLVGKCLCFDWQASAKAVSDGWRVLYRSSSGDNIDQTCTALRCTDSRQAQTECMYCHSYLCSSSFLVDTDSFKFVFIFSFRQFSVLFHVADKLSIYQFLSVPSLLLSDAVDWLPGRAFGL